MRVIPARGLGTPNFPISTSPTDFDGVEMNRIFGREPAWLLGVAAALLTILSSTVLPLTQAQQGVLNAALAAGFGLWTAYKVKDGTWVAALVALAKAGIALALAFNFNLSPELQGGVMALVLAVGAGYLRTQVRAPLAANGHLSLADHAAG